MNGTGPRLGILGAGRMGQRVAALAADAGYILSALVARGPVEGPWPCVSKLESLPAIDLLIDFSLPEGTRAAARWCAGRQVPLVSGATGLGADEQSALDAAAGQVAVLHATNFSPGLNALRLLLGDAAALLGDAAGVRLLDVHHVHKLDAPSGTALTLRDAAGAPDAPIESRREGEVIGDHAVTFSLPNETVTLAHHASSRDLFATGALRAGHWLLGQAPGRYDALDWIRGERNDR